MLVDGQGSGLAAKMLSNALSSKAVAMLKEGVRDGAVARATHDYLHHYRGGKVSATLDIVSIDLTSRTIVVCRNSHCPLLVSDAEGIRLRAAQALPIGPGRHVRPEISQLPVAAGVRIMLFTDGILSAGERRGVPLDLVDVMTTSLASEASAAALADGILAAAIQADDNRPADDMTVVAVSITARSQIEGPLVRRMTATLPVDGLMAPRW